jgi:hypothetical protein
VNDTGFEGTSTPGHASGKSKLNFVEQQVNCTDFCEAASAWHATVGQLKCDTPYMKCDTPDHCVAIGVAMYTPIRLRSLTAPASSSAVKNFYGSSSCDPLWDERTYVPD